MSFSFGRAAAAAAFLVVAPNLAMAADTAERVSGADVAQALTQLGLSAQEGVDSYGEPMVMSNVSGQDFVVLFYDCDKATPMTCAELQFSAEFAFSPAPTLEQLNTYNAGSRYSQVYIQNGTTKMDMYMMVKGGVAVENFNAYVERWKRNVENFQKELFNPGQ
jgi:hypothetical protein